MGVFSVSKLRCEKKTTDENDSQFQLGKKSLHKRFAEIDKKFADEMREGGCVHCAGGELHRADYRRSVRPVEVFGRGSKTDAGAEWEKRFSFCCSEDGCRKRHTPASVRFLGRRVYAGVVVVLLTALSHGLNAERVEVLRIEFGMDVKTLKRWRQWWLREVVGSRFWKGFRRRFSTPVCEETLPLSLCKRFGYHFCAQEEQTEQQIEQQHVRLAALLTALSPLSLPGAKNNVM